MHQGSVKRGGHTHRSPFGFIELQSSICATSDFLPPRPNTPRLSDLRPRDAGGGGLGPHDQGDRRLGGGAARAHHVSLSGWVVQGSNRNKSKGKGKGEGEGKGEGKGQGKGKDNVRVRVGEMVRVRASV